ncbi:unnamed protein product [Camellia sinensis]
MITCLATPWQGMLGNVVAWCAGQGGAMACWPGHVGHHRGVAWRGVLAKQGDLYFVLK